MANYLYTPKGAAREFGAPLAINTYLTCEHACTYCYVPLVLHKKTAIFHAPTPRKIDFAALTREAERKAATAQGLVFLSFASDPFQPLEDEEHATAKTISILKRAGFSLVILTKDPMRAWKYAADLDPATDKIGTTLTTLDPEQAAQWEPGAPEPASRMAGLEIFHQNGFYTWVSLEPLVDPVNAGHIIASTAHYTDHYKIGTLNYGGRCQEIRDHAAQFDWTKHTGAISGYLLNKGFRTVYNIDAWEPKSYYPKRSFMELFEEENWEND